MPELPEVETTRAGIASYVEHKTVQSIVIRCQRLRYPLDRQLSQRLAKHKVLSLARRGKYLLMQFKHGYLIIHLGMSGSLKILPHDTPIKKHDHIDINFKQHCLRYHDPRRFGLILWTTSIDTHPLLNKLGPEPLSVAFSHRHLQRVLSNKKTTIKQAIMDAEIVVGVGNIYASESLFKAKISPWQSANQLSQQQCQALVKAIKQILRQAIRAGGTTLKDFTQADGKPGYFKQHLLTYGRAGEPCVNCDQPIESQSIGGRNTFYCPSCQGSAS